MIASIINSVAIVILAIVLIKQAKTISELKEDTWELKYNRNHISTKKQQEIEEGVRKNRQVVGTLVGELGKKIEPIKTKKYIIHSYFDAEPQEVTEIIGYKIVDLTEAEKKARNLWKELEELESEEE